MRINLYVILIFIFISVHVSAQMSLEYNIKTPNTEIKLPLGGPITNVAVDWGDGASENFTTPGDKGHTYSAIGTYTVNITGSLSKFGSQTNSTGNKCLTKVIGWENLGLTNLDNAFSYAPFLTVVPDSIPKNVSLTRSMFYGDSLFNYPIGNWNMSNVLDMSSMFAKAKSFNQDISGWNTSKVRDMSHLFWEASSFNQPIGNWDVSNVVRTNLMFASADKFNQPIGNWNTASVTSMYTMFGGAKAFNQDLNNWNTSNVTNMG